jgi:hypothetical protein
MDHSIVCIAPRLPPADCGVGDAAWLSVSAWPDSENNWSFIVCDGENSSSAFLQVDNIIQVGTSSSRLFTALCTLATPNLILHYANRGYHRFGCPFWLLRGLSRWIRHNQLATTLLVYFHEVSPLLKSASHHTLISLGDRYITEKLGLMASCVVTNTLGNKKNLEQLLPSKTIYTVPVFSNITSPNVCPNPQHRHRKNFVIFGMPSTQLYTLKLFDRHLKTWLEDGLIDRIHVIGPISAQVQRLYVLNLQPSLQRDSIIWHGKLAAADVSRILSAAGFCISPVNQDSYNKSGSFLAFASHGCPVISEISSRELPFCYFVDPSEVGVVDYSVISARSKALYQWYHAHTSPSSFAASLAALLRCSVDAIG